MFKLKLNMISTLLNEHLELQFFPITYHFEIYEKSRYKCNAAVMICEYVNDVVAFLWSENQLVFSLKILFTNWDSRDVY